MPIRSRLAFGYDRPEIFFLCERKLDDHQTISLAIPLFSFFFLHAILAEDLYLPRIYILPRQVSVNQKD